MAIQKSFYGRLCFDNTKRAYKNSQGKKGLMVTNTLAEDLTQDETFFIKFIAFGKTAELIYKYTSKGSAIMLHGQLQNNDYEDKKGNTQHSVQLVVSSIDFTKNNEETEDKSKSKSKAKSRSKSKSTPKEDDDDFDLDDDDFDLF